MIQKTLLDFHRGWSAFFKRHNLPTMEPLPKITSSNCRPGFKWSVVDPPGLTTKHMRQLYEAVFKPPPEIGSYWSWRIDLHKYKILTKEARRVQDARTILIKASDGPDKKWLGNSALEIERKKILSITPRKWLLLVARLKEERELFLKTSTVFAGFRDYMGHDHVPYGVPGGNFTDMFPYRKLPDGGIREVVIVE
jgi:hypothetical protein